MTSTDTLIIGGGITGLSAASFLGNSDYLLIEKEDEVGGYCRTIQQGEFVWDYSGHFFHFRDNEIKKYLLENVQDEILEVKKKSSIYYKDRFIDFPFQDNVHQLTFFEFLESLRGLIVKNNTSINNFEDFVIGNLGKDIAEKFILPYNKKLYGCELNDLDVECMGRFFPKTMEVFDYIKKLIFGRRNINYNDYFIYPKNGAFEFIKSLQKRIPNKNIQLNTSLINLDIESNVAVTNRGPVKFNKIINTTPFNFFSKFFYKEPPILSCNKVVVYNLGFDRGTQIKDNWIYFPGNEIFYRVGFYNNLYSGGLMSLYVEIGLSNNETENSEITLDRVIKDLEKVGIVDNHILKEHKKLILNPAYVHITKESNNLYKDWCDTYNEKKYYSIGRYGQWTYCSMEDNIIQAKETVEKLLN